MVLKGDYAEYAIGDDGANVRFVDRRTGVNCCDSKTKTPFARVRKGGREFGATTAALVSSHEVSMHRSGTVTPSPPPSPST